MEIPGDQPPLFLLSVQELLREGAKALRIILQGSLVSPLPGDIPDDALVSQDSPILSSPQACREQAIPHSPVLPAPPDLIVPEPSPSFYMPLKPRSLIRILIEVPDVQMHQFFPGIAEEVDHRLVKIEEGAISPYNIHGVP